MTQTDDPARSRGARPRETVPARLAQALSDFADETAFVDADLTLSYGQLAACTARLARHLPETGPVAVFGKPATVFAAAASACVILGRPFVHLDPAMPREVLGNILSELAIDLVFECEPPKPGQLPDTCTRVDVHAVIGGLAGALAGGLADASAEGPEHPIVAAEVAPDDVIYIVATSGTTGKPKCIPVTQDAAYLSYEWRDAFTPYRPGQRVGVYIFAIWEMFRPLRDGATMCFPSFAELLSPGDLAAFLIRHDVREMLFTPSALERILQAATPDMLRAVPLERIILNGEVVSDGLRAAAADKLPGVRLWNLYSICETHDIAMSDLTGAAEAGAAEAGSVGVAMPHLRAVVLDDADRECAAGVAGLLHFEGPRMLGPGYVNRPEETALRFRDLVLEGRDVRLYDTGDQGHVTAAGEIHVLGRVAHMLKLRGHSIQTRELTQSLAGFVGFTQGVPWIQAVPGQGDALVFYYCAGAGQAAENAARWGLGAGETRMPAPLSRALRGALPAYCIPSHMVRLEAIPINTVSGKCDFKALPPVTAPVAAASAGGDAPPVVALAVVALAAEVLGCAVASVDPGLSFHDQGGDSLMAVTLTLALEEAYGRRVDFDFALNLPLGRLHEILTARVGSAVTGDEGPGGHAGERAGAHAGDRAGGGAGRFDRPGILLTGVTGFLGSRVMAAAARDLPEGEVIHCLVRPRRRDALDRLREIAAARGVDPDRLVLVPAAMEDARFGLGGADYRALCGSVRRVIHCAAMVNLAVDRAQMEIWSRAGIANIVQFCRDSGADLRYSSSSAVYPDVGGPFAEAPAAPYPGCSGYGAAKLQAESRIAASGIGAAIVRLPSLYDLDAPNGHDIYEIILKACAAMGAVPEGLTFRMIDVEAAARFLAGVGAADGARYFNLAPDTLVGLDHLPSAQALRVMAPEAWLAAAPLSEAERALLGADRTILAARSVFAHGAASAAWAEISALPFGAISDPAALLGRRFGDALAGASGEIAALRTPSPALTRASLR